jgi:hypothetical protein
MRLLAPLTTGALFRAGRPVGYSPALQARDDTTIASIDTARETKGPEWRAGSVTRGPAGWPPNP